jgi:hypothetical protein
MNYEIIATKFICATAIIDLIGIKSITTEDNQGEVFVVEYEDNLSTLHISGMIAGDLILATTERLKRLDDAEKC